MPKRLSVRPIRRDDLRLLHAWLQREHVKRWWSKRETRPQKTWASAHPASIQRISYLDAHVDELCDRHGIERLNGGRGRAIRRGGRGEATLQIRIPPVRGQVTYFVAMHEIGHLVGRGRSGLRLEKEAAAWRWALANAIVEPTQASRRSMGRRLRSYVRWAELRQHRRRPPVIPPQQSGFWRLLADLEA